MKITFEDDSYVECKKAEDGKLYLIISAKDHNSPLKNITNAVEITVEQFKQLISEVI